MQIMQRFQPRLIGLTLGVVLALLIWPATRWLVWSQFTLSIPTTASVAPWSGGSEENPEAWRIASRRYHETALRHPNDYLLQFADAVMVAPAGGELTAEVRVLRLRSLTKRFPGRAPLYAAALRFATLKEIRIERDEVKWLSGENAQVRSVPGPPHNTPEQLDAYDRNAAEGERLDPDNAYFPLMRSIGLFAAHKDAQALFALQRAAQKQVWNDYCSEEIDGEWKLHQETFGESSALSRMMFAFAILFPHYSQIRSSCHVAITEAAQSEKAGRIEDGLRIRACVRQCGRLMRIQSTNVLGSLIGIVLNQVSMSRPDGAPPIAQRPRGSREQRAIEFESYLKRIGHAEKIADWRFETDEGDRALHIAQSGSHIFFDTTPVNLASSWIAAIILLTNVLWMLAIGAAATLLARFRLIRSGQGFPPGERFGPALGIAAGVLLAMRLAVMGLLHKHEPACFGLLAGGLIVSIIALALPRAKCPIWLRRIGGFLLSLTSTTLLCSAFVWQIGASLQSIVHIMWGMYSETSVPAAPIIQILCIGLALIIPCLSLLTFAVLSRVWRVPLSVGVVRGYRGCAAPIACILLLAYGILIPFVLSQETALDYGLKRTVQHEGRFAAELTGQKWPGDTQ